MNMRCTVLLQVVLAVSSTACSKKKSEPAKPVGITVEDFVAMLKTEDGESFKVALAKAPNTQPKVMWYDSGRVYADVIHPWFRQVSCDVDQRTGVPTGKCMFTFRASVKGRVDEMADAFAAVHPDLSPPKKRITDAVTDDYKIDLGEAGGWEPGGPLFICSLSRDPECKRISIALVTAPLPPPPAPQK